MCKWEIISGLLFHFWSAAQSYEGFDDGKWRKENPLAKYLLNRAPFSSGSGNMKVQICLLLKNFISVLICNRSPGAVTISFLCRFILSICQQFGTEWMFKVNFSLFFPLTCSTKKSLSQSVTKMSHGDKSVKYESDDLVLAGESALVLRKTLKDDWKKCWMEIFQKSLSVP